MQPLTNYRMGTGLASTIMGQQAGLEAESQGLANVFKAAQIPKELLLGQESMALLNNPEYLKANEQFQLQATQAKLGDAEKQNAVNGLDRLLIQLQANPDPVAQQQLILKSFQEKGVDPTSPMGQAILADPFGKTKEARDKLVSTMGYTPQVAGKMQEQAAVDEAAMARTKYKGGIDLQQSQIQAGSAAATANKNLTGQMIQYSGQLRQELDGLNNNITKLEGKELDSAIMQDFMNRNKKAATPQDVEAEKGKLKAALIQRRDAIQTELDSVRGEVRSQLKLGQKQPAGTKEDPIKLP